jgi:hypothetical protein
VAKGQKRSNKERRKPKKSSAKPIASTPSVKSVTTSRPAKHVT